MKDKEGRRDWGPDAEALSSPGPSRTTHSRLPASSARRATAAPRPGHTRAREPKEGAASAKRTPYPSPVHRSSGGAAPEPLLGPGPVPASPSPSSAGLPAPAPGPQRRKISLRLNGSSLRLQARPERRSSRPLGPPRRVGRAGGRVWARERGATSGSPINSCSSSFRKK